MATVAKGVASVAEFALDSGSDICESIFCAWVQNLALFSFDLHVLLYLSSTNPGSLSLQDEELHLSIIVSLRCLSDSSCQDSLLIGFLVMGLIINVIALAFSGETCVCR
jgi:hypothetical protein